MSSATAALGQETIAPDEATVMTQFISFLRAASEKRYPAGTLRRRFNQARASGCVTAQFTVLDGIAAEHRVGIFAVPQTYRAWVRFANASTESDRERDTRGMAIKLFDVGGSNLTPTCGDQDFILNSYPVMMVPGPREFLELLRANEAGGMQRALYFLSHPKAASIAFASRTSPSCHLDIPYWSTTPYRLGANRAVKYLVRPASHVKSRTPHPLTDNYLREELQARLSADEVSFDFLIQPQVNAQRHPIEDASVEWREHDAPCIKVATIRIPAQQLDEPAHVARCEQISFNPWNALTDHRPLGGMNRSRRDIYRAMKEFREEKK